MSQTESEVKNIVSAAASRKAGFRALQLIRNLVDEAKEEDREKRAAVKSIVLGMLLVVVCLVTWGAFNYGNRAESSYPVRETPAAMSYVELLSRHIAQVSGIHSQDELAARSASERVSLRVIVKADGHIEDVLLLNSSGNQSFDNSMLRLVRAADPLPPFPAELRNTTDILELTTSVSVDGSGRLVLTR